MGAHGIFQLRQLLLAETFHILHAHDGKGQTISWLASLGMNVSRVASRRVTFAPPRRIDTRLKYGLTCAAVIAVSRHVRQILIDSGVPHSKIEVIYDGVEIPKEMPGAMMRAGVRAQWDCGDQDFVVGMMSPATYEKGGEIAREAASILRTSVPNARIVMAASRSGLPKGGLQATIAKGTKRGARGSENPVADHASNLRFIDFPPERADFFGALDLFIMPSLAEGLGSAALLANAYGIPVVASRVGGLPEIIEDGETGWLVPPGSPQALAGAIAHAASDRMRLREMGNKARQRAEQFSSTLMVERTEGLYEKLLEERFKG
jgi:glycosyltransferase involved in cell wall biosynthesis